MVVIFPTQDQVANFINGFVSNVSGKVNITITLDSTPHQKTLTSKKGHNNYVTLPVYFGDDDISGRIDLQLRDSYKYDHLGLKCFLIGYLEIYNDSNLSTEFTLLSKELQPAGYLTSNKFFKFKFSHFDKQYESFKGSAGCVRYFIRASLQRNVVGPLILEQEFAVTVADRVQKMPLVPTILDVGVNDRLQIQFILQKNAYHTKEWVEGKVKFLKLKMPVIKMEISLVRKETLGTADSTFSQSKVLQVFQVMDGCPDEGDMVPFRMCMRGVKNLTPSYKSIHNRLFVRHWFTVTIYDQQGSKYFKQSEITFYRK